MDRGDLVHLPEPERPTVGSTVGRDFTLVLVGAVALLALMIAGDRIGALQPVRRVLGLAYILYVPGYCVTSALFPRADDLDGIERAGLSMGLSIALVPVLALVLDRLPWGLRLWPILIGAYTVTLACMGIAVWRRARLPQESRSIPQLRWRPRSWWRSVPRAERRSYALLACALVVAGSAAAWGLASGASDRHMTEFYILGRQGLGEDYPWEAVVNEDVSVTIGIVNREKGPRVYRAEVWAMDPWQPDLRRQVYVSDSLPLAPGEAREWPVSWRMPRAGDDQVVELFLFADSDDQPYRMLRLWMNVTDGK